MLNLRTLWMDLTVAVREDGPPPEFRRWCEFTYCSDRDEFEEFVVRRASTTDLVCFNFDYPDRSGLRLLRTTKVDHPSLSVVMLTVQHSEALAIWAFRNKVWDYLVKPVRIRDVERCFVSLSRALEHRNVQEPRSAATLPERIPAEVPFLAKMDDPSLAPSLYYIEQNFRGRVSSEDVAARCGLSPFRFSRLFKETFGLTFRDYLINYRLREAYRLLENPTVTVADVAFAVGFNDPSYFARIFKQRVGTTPSALIGHERAQNFDELGLQPPGLSS